jgi:hypothetical protein
MICFRSSSPSLPFAPSQKAIIIIVFTGKQSRKTGIISQEKLLA